MSSVADQSNFPTMIIPKGTEIRLNTAGQLSIKTPGNLVIQNSGNYSELESTSGSIRIEENVHVEAISVKAAQACFIQGTLTAWRVKAKKIALEDRAKANIMLQESETLELSKSSRLVGNFANEKEIYLLLAKFSPQLKQLPANMDVHAPTELGEHTNPHMLRSSHSAPEASQPAAAAAPKASAAPLPEALQHASALLERELSRPDIGSANAEALREVSFALREHDLSRVQTIYRDAFREITTPSEQIRAAYNFIAFRRTPPGVQTSSASCALCAAIESSPEVAREGEVILFAPSESRLAYELCLTTVGHHAEFHTPGDETRSNVAKLLRLAMIAMDELLGAPSFNWIIDTARHRDGRALDHHWSLSITPRLTTFAGFELATGVMVNIIEPAVAADRYIDALRKGALR